MEHTTTHTTLETITDALRPKSYTSQAEADTWGLFDATARTHRARSNAHEERLTYLKRFKGKKHIFGEEHIAERLVYSRFFDTQIGERTANGIDGIIAALEDKRIEVKLHMATKAHDKHQYSSHTSQDEEAAAPTARLTV
jgi:hypothetical protein